jgi:ABC-type methionine transport system permease subunit
MDEADGPLPLRDETAAERDDRNWTELLQEVRVTQTGIQILSGFLLTVPFQSRFTDLSPGLVSVFLAAVGFAAVSTLLVVAPVSLHRTLFRRHRKKELVDVSDAFAKAGLVCLAVTITLVTGLVFGFVLGEGAALVAIPVAALAFFATWLALPLVVRSRPGGG